MVATGGNQWQMRHPENGGNKLKPSPWVATACRLQRMVKGTIQRARCCPKWRTTGAHPSIYSVFLTSPGYTNTETFPVEPVLTIRQAWASAIFRAGKDVENRGRQRDSQES